MENIDVFMDIDEKFPGGKFQQNVKTFSAKPFDEISGPNSTEFWDRVDSGFDATEKENVRQSWIG